MNDSSATEKPAASAEKPSPLDPLEETQGRVRVVLSRHPLRAIFIVFFVISTFVAGIAVSGVIEDAVVMWFREKVIPSLRQYSISNGWLLLFLTAGLAFLIISLILAVYNHKQVKVLRDSLAIRGRHISELHGVLDNQKRLLDHFQHNRASHEERFRQLADALKEQMEREQEIQSILDEAIILMTHSILSGGELPETARQRFFGVYKRTVPRLFTRPENIRNVCVLEPKGDYLCFGSHCTIPLPSEVERIAHYYVGHDDSRRHDSGLEGMVYVQIDADDSNLADIDPLIIEVSNRLEDRAPSQNAYIGFYGRAGLVAPFASYVIVPISHQWGILRVESLATDTFGPPQFGILKHIARKLDLAFTVTSVLSIGQGDMQNE